MNVLSGEISAVFDAIIFPFEIFGVINVSNIGYLIFERLWVIFSLRSNSKLDFCQIFFKHFADLAPIPCHKLRDLEPAISIPK